jgi:2-dehydropantoate 2-reductase
MHWVILGAGALGSILAVHLQRHGEEVTLLARGSRARLLRTQGVTLTGLTEATARVNVLDEPGLARPADVFVLTVKTYDTDAALRGVARLQAAAAFSVQNGVVKDEQLAAVFGSASVIGAAADFSGEVMPDGRVRFTRNEGLHLGELGGGTSPRVDAIIATLNSAGIKAMAAPDIVGIEWSKLVGWLSLTSVAVLTRLETDVMLADPDLARLQWLFVREVAAVTRSLNVPLGDLVGVAPARTMTELDAEEWVARSLANAEAMRKAGVTGHKMSALQDLEHGRRLEVEETFGYMLRKAEQLGIAIPRLATCYHLIAGLSRAAAGP